MASLSVKTLSGDSRFETEIRLARWNIKTVLDFKKLLAGQLAILVARLDIVNMADVLLFDDQHTLTSGSNLGNPVHVVIHPETRTVFEHLVTDAKDMIMDFEEDDRTGMSCGHGIVPENLYDLCWNSLKDGALQFKCPAIDSFNVRGTQTTCGQIWSLYELTVKAQLSTDERILFEMRLCKNSLQKDSSIQECPFCKCFSARESEKNNRVRCLNCCQSNPDKSEFCWKCLHPWTNTTVTEFCGNVECVTAKGPQMSQEILRTCQKITIDHYHNVPSVRECPSCKALVEHTRGCKRMPCKCSFQFCFVCLLPWSSDGCGYNKNCKAVAPCQKIL